MPRDPYRNFRFVVEIDGFVRAGFNKVTGIKHTVAVTDYREGGDNEVMRKLPGQSTFDPLVLERGISDDEDFQAWQAEIFSVTNVGQSGSVEAWRRDVVIYLKDKAGVFVKKWTYKNCWPSDNEFSDLDAGDSGILVDTLTLQNEGYEMENLAAA